MDDARRIDVAKLKRDVIACTGPGKEFSRRGLSLKASNGTNPDLIRDFLSRGRDKSPSAALVTGLASAMGKDPSEYYIGVDSAPQKERISVLGQVQAGIWREHPEWPEGERYTVEVDPSPYPGAERFALEMVGFSMEKLIPPGSILECLRVFGQEGPQPVDGDIVIVERRQGSLIETTCKRLEITTEGTFILHAESYRDEFRSPIFMGKPDPNDFSDNDVRVIAIVDKATQWFFRRRSWHDRSQ